MTMSFLDFNTTNNQMITLVSSMCVMYIYHQYVKLMFEDEQAVARHHDEYPDELLG
jgi:tetrahydromethanopterin S-methyltransferase subunit C